MLAPRLMNTDRPSFEKRKLKFLPLSAVILCSWHSSSPAASFSEIAAPTSLNKSAVEKIIGTDDLQDVADRGINLSAELRPFIDAIGQLNTGCTASHIGDGRVLTAGHCISVSPRSSSNSCHLLGVVWGNYGSKKDLKASKCKKIIYRKLSSSEDIAILQVENPPKSALQIETSERAEDLPHETTMLSFPRMRPMQWSGLCTVLTYDKPTSPVLKFLHSCDSENGSSGAPIFALDTLKVIGVHGGSADELNYATFTHSVRDFL